MKLIKILGLTLAVCIFNSSYSINALEEKINAKEGEEFVVSINLSDKKDENSGINVYSMRIDYDKSIFEPLSKNDFKSLGEWNDVIYNPENGMFTSVNGAGAKSSDDVVEVTFKVKEGSKAQKTDIKVSDIKVSANGEEIPYEDKKLTVDVIQKDLLPGDTINSSENNNEVASEENRDLLDIADIIALSGITLLIVGQVIFIVLIKKGAIKHSFVVTNKKTSLLALKIAIIMEACILLGITTRVVYNFNNSNMNINEVNHEDNGGITNSKIEEMQKALIQLESKPNNKMDGNINDEIKEPENGKVENTAEESEEKPSDESVEKPSDEPTEKPPSIGDIEEEVDKEYEDKVKKTTIVDLKYNYYPEKNSVLELLFTIDQDVVVDKLVIDNVEYLAKKVGNREFKVQLTSAKEAGVQEFHITELKISPDYKKTVDKVVQIDVLKERPQVEMASFKEEESSDKTSANISFNLIDDDKSIKNSYVNIKNKKGKIYKTFEVKAGENNINIPLELDEKYTAEIIVDYDLDTNKLNDVTGSKNEVKEEVLLEKPVQIVREYNFTVGNIHVEREDGIYGREDKIKVYLTSSNSSDFEPEYVKINSRYYTLTKVESTYKANRNKTNLYVAEIDGYDTTGEKSIEVEEIILKNGKSFTVREFIPEGESNKVEVEILKKKPVVSDLNVAENIDKSTLQVNVDITDEDNVLIKRSVVLKDAEGNILDSKELSGNKEEVILNTRLTSKYTIEVVADYDVSNDNSNATINDVIYEEEIDAESKVNITDSGVSDYYLEKNSEVKAYYSFETNYSDKISKIIINNREVTLNKNKDESIAYEYFVTLPLSDVAGVVEIEATKVIFNDGREINISNIQKVEVLKDIPVLKNYTVKSDIDNNTVTIKFDIKDSENSLISAKALLGSKEEVVKNGSNELTYAITPGEILDFKVLATYDRDTNAINDITGEANVITDEEIFNSSVQLAEDYNLIVSELKTFKGNDESKYFEKNEEIFVAFKSTNNSKYIPEKVMVNKTEYEVKSSNDTYYFSLSGLSQSGKEEFVLEQIKLTNGKVLSVDKDNEFEIEILKDAPAVKNDSVSSDINTDSVTIKFDIEDTDNSFVSAKAIFGSEEEVVEIGSNELTFKIKSGETVDFKVLVNYDRDTNAIDNDANFIENDEIFNKSIQLVEDYNLTLSELTTYKGGNEFKYFEKNEKISVGFKSTNNSIFTPEKVRVDGTEYDIEQNADKYYFTMNELTQAGHRKFVIDQVTLSNGKELSVNNEFELEVLKDKPVVKDYSVSSDINNNTVTINFNIEDTDSSLLSAKAVLGNNEQAVNSDSNSVTFAIKSGEIVDFKVLATYDRDTNVMNNGGANENVVADDEIFKESVQLVENYDLKVSEFKAYKGNNEYKYFNKNEEIKLSFRSTNNSKFIPKKVRINNLEYEVQSSNDIYYVTMPGLMESGVERFVIEQITLTNDKVLDVNSDNEVSIEILKDKPIVNNYKVDEETKGKMKISFTLVDDDSALNNATLVIENRNSKKLKKVSLSNSIFRRSKVQLGHNEFEFKTDGSEEYFVYLTVDYDLDTNILGSGDNEYTNKDLLNEIITVKSRSIELKDITSIDVYRQEDNGESEIVKNIDLNKEINLDEYLVKVNMKNIPSRYAKIKEYNIIDDELTLVLDIDNVVQYDGSQSKESIEVWFGYVKDNVASDPSFEDLIERIKQNPSGTFKLKKDFDASAITTGNAVIDRFEGVLDGNGHTISGLSRPLIHELNGGEVKNLRIKNSKFTRGWTVDASSIFINYTTNAKVNNIIIDKIDITAGYRTAVVVGEDKKGSIFDNITIRNSSVYGGMINSGVFMGIANDSIISNVIIVNTKYRTAGNWFNGSFIGKTNGKTKISNIVTNIDMLGGGGDTRNSGFIGHVSDTETITNVVTLGNTYSSYYKTLSEANSTSTVISNSYEKNSTTGINNTVNQGIQQVNEETLKIEEFYRDTLKLDPDKWDFSDVSINGYPSLKYESKENQKYDIPNNEHLSNLDSYDLNRLQIYENMQKLMPFTDSEYIVIDGNKVPESHEFNEKKIRTVFPIDENGKRIIALTDKNYKDVSKIKVLFEDESVYEYNIRSKNITNNIARYNISNLNIEYNFNKYIQNEESVIIKELANKIRGFDYNRDILTRPNGTDDIPRLFRDHYNQIIKNRAEEIAIYIVANNSEYASYSDDNVIYTIIKKELIENDYLKDLMYVFTYVDKWYDFEIGGINLRDIILFDNSIFDKKHSTQAVVKDFIGNSSIDGRKGNNTQGLYKNRFSQFTGLANVDEFVEYLIRTFDDEKYKEDINNWILDNFKGGVIHESIGEFEGGENLDQRLWSYLKQNRATERGQNILPILSYKGKDLYIFSVPTQIAYGNLNLYSEYKGDDESRAVMKEKIIAMADELTTFYENTAKIVKNPISALNDLRQVQIDSTRIDGQGKLLDFNTTEDSVYKNIYLPLYWRDGGNNGAVANTWSKVVWNNGYLLESLSTYTHETSHNQDNRLFFENNTQRNDPWTGEDFTNGFITQNFASGEYNMNLVKDWNRDSDITTNLTPDRINSPEKIKDFYSKVFETLDIMDYLQGQAFLKLTPAQQANIAQQHQYKNGNRRDSIWVTKSAKDFENMNLQTIEDLYDNELNIIPNRVNGNVVNSYTPDYIYFTHWYQPYNDNGKPNPVIMKRNYWYLLSKYGYSDGLIKYAVKINGREMGDLDRMKLITGNSNFTWKGFALERFDGIEEKINRSIYFDKEDIINEFYNAFVESANDSNNLNHNSWGGSVANKRSMDARLRVYRYLQRITDDFRVSIYSDQVDKIDITSGEQFIEEVNKNPNGYFVLKNDIELQDVPDSEVIIDKTFIGKIEGDGYTIHGLTKPIFRRVNNSYISDLILKKDIDSIADKTLLGKTISSTIIAEDKVYKSDISSINDLKSINMRPNGTYRLVNDIDVSSITDETIIMKDFKGKLDGNGYTITGLKAPLFNHIAGTVENLKIKDATIDKGSNDYANVFAKTSEGATIKNIELYNVNVTGNNYVTPFIGSDKNSNISKVAIKNSRISITGDYGSGFIGKTEGSNIDNILVGEVEVNLGKAFNAGFIGQAINTRSINNYVSVNMTESNNISVESIAGFIGNSTDSIFRNIISGSYVPDNIKTVMPTEEAVLSSIQNGYELNTFTGISSITDNTKSVLKETTLESVGNGLFLTGEAGFDSNLWDTSRVSELLYPEINNLNTYSKPGILKIMNIEALKRISENLNASYTLGRNVDVSSFDEGILIPGTFTGTLEGNGFTITGLRNALFENLQGTVKNFKIKNANVDNLDGKGNVLARQTNNANVTNVHFEKINITGNDYTASISGKDIGSTFNNISLKSVNVEAKGRYSGVFIGEAYNSNISNILILESNISISQNYSGGFIGCINQSKVDKVFVDVDSNFDKYSINPVSSRSSGFIGQFNYDFGGTYNNITNSVTIGDVSNPEMYKFIGYYSYYTADSHGRNNFECIESTGKALNKNLSQGVRRAELSTEDFYKNRVSFDESIWDLSTVVTNGYPILKGMK